MPELRLPERLRPPKPRRPSRSCPAHRAWVRKHRCSVPGCQRLPIECAHVRTGAEPPRARLQVRRVDEVRQRGHRERRLRAKAGLRHGTGPEADTMRARQADHSADLGESTHPVHLQVPHRRTTQLDELPAGRFTFTAAPPRVVGMGTWPVRAYAVIE